MTASHWAARLSEYPGVDVDRFWRMVSLNLDPEFAFTILTRDIR